MSLQFLAKKLEGQSLREEEIRCQKDREEDSGTESEDDEIGDDAVEEEEVSYTGRRFELHRTIFRQFEDSSCTPPPTGISSSNSLCSQNERSTCDIDDNYSSEEELKEIISEKQPPGFSGTSTSSTSVAAEKRKWSEIDGSDSESETQSPAFVIRSVSSSSVEDEKYTLGVTTPVQFRTSPPLDVHRPRQSQSPPPKFFHLSSTTSSEPGQSSDIPIIGDQSKRHHRRHSGDSRHYSPSKRHRSTPRPHNIQRPCLDFEKMQQIKKRVVTSWRPKGTELSLFCW
ncbi:uncharacterized protein Reph [Lepeophtheirus salmonis]|uniref:Uncharacterized protein n=1 Tax=Lepeophtheirus salmonis TaxID=72036 RepID=A0A0K2UGT7_LEPSM|nr:uncharacterized protein LOC121125024 [Lepeophtheirus salmonis]XP_040576051.1 uncharacterized protein LOC121125024 [Lepeophtheirus salmonis]